MKQQLDILLCEDDPNLGKLLRDFLGPQGLQHHVGAGRRRRACVRFRVGSYDFRHARRHDAGQGRLTKWPRRSGA